MPVAMAAVVVKRKRADARAKAKAALQGGSSPQLQPLVVAGDGDAPLTPAAGEVAAAAGAGAGHCGTISRGIC